jgi:serpin B
MSGVRNLLAGTGIGLCALGLVACSGSSDSHADGAAGADAATGGSPALGGSAGQEATGGSGPATGGSAGQDATGGSGPATGGSPGLGGSAGEQATGGSGPATGGSAGAQPVVEEARSELPHDTTPDISEADYQAFISNTNDFGFDVFDQLVGDDTNVVFSPVSTAVALGMTYAGARGDTATQMATALHNDLPDAAFHAAQNQLALDLASRNIAPHETIDGTKSVRLSLVNAAWGQQDYPILPDFLDILSENYDAGIKLLDFIADPDGSRQVINQWVADQTEDKIEDLIPPDGITDDTRLVLTNALYFYATWAVPFLVEATDEGVFHTLAGDDVTVQMMHDTAYYPYAEGPGYQLVDLPYDGNELSMTILLPEAGSFAEIRDSLSDEWLSEARASMSQESEIQLSLPKFSFTWGTASLKPALQQLGMTDAFVYPIADFTGIESTRELYISDVFHQAFIAVDEHGTEAAAATAVVLTAGAIPDPPIPFAVDRPFIFFIRDATGLILFAGQVVDPSG